MPFLFQSSDNTASGSQGVGTSGFIVSKAPTTYGPGTIVLITILGLTFVAYAALYSYRVKVSTETELVHREIANLELSRNKKLEAEIFMFEKRIKALSRILRSHITMSKIFPVLEDLALPTIFYDSANIMFTQTASSPSGDSPSIPIVQVTLTGSAVQIIDLARQMIVFRDDPTIRSGEMSSYSISNLQVGIKFTADLNFDGKVVSESALK